MNITTRAESSTPAMDCPMTGLVHKHRREMMEWKHIETAPKEHGARVLLFGYASTYGGSADLKQPIIRCGRRENNTFSRMVKVEDSDLFRCEDYVSVRWVDDQTYLTDDRLLPPTHWMPLPAPPLLHNAGDNRPLGAG